MRTRDFLRQDPLRLLTILLAVGAASPGCSPKAEPYAPGQEELVPVSGRVTVDGEPLAGAVVAFLQTDERGTTSGADTDEDGRYELSFRGQPGTAPATYKVAVSYKVGKNGEPLDRAARFSPSLENGRHLAKEQIPREFSDLGRTVLKVTVPPGGGTFDFPLKGPLITPPPDAEPVTRGAVDGAPKDVPKGPDGEAGDTKPTPLPR
jgi:hypothetical protein